MKKIKYRELVELKGLLVQKKIRYIDIAKHTDMCLNAVSDKLNGYSVFDLNEANKIINLLNIPSKKIPYYFF